MEVAQLGDHLSPCHYIGRLNWYRLDDDDPVLLIGGDPDIAIAINCEPIRAVNPIGEGRRPAGVPSEFTGILTMFRFAVLATNANWQGGAKLTKPQPGGLSSMPFAPNDGKRLAPWPIIGFSRESLLQVVKDPPPEGIL
jgi:hypothetical protein